MYKIYPEWMWLKTRILDLKAIKPDLRQRFMQLMTSSAYDIIERWFESPMVKSMYGSSCFSGNFASLKQPGSAIPFFHSVAGRHWDTARV